MSSNDKSSRPLADTDALADETEESIDMSDSEALISRGGQAIEASGNDLGRAASGEFPDVDLEMARERMRDCQSALLSLGYSLGEHDEPADAAHGMADEATAAAISQFQDDNDLDVTGIIDRDTYETLLRSLEQATSLSEHTQLEDDATPPHTTDPLHDSTQMVEAVDGDAEAIDESEEVLLNLRDDLPSDVRDRLAEDL